MAVIGGGISLPLIAVAVTIYTCGPPGTVPVTITSTGESFRFETEGRRMHRFVNQVFLPPGRYELKAISRQRTITDEITVNYGEQYLSVHDDGRITVHN